MNSAILKENQGPRKDFKMLKYALKRLLVEVQAKKSIRRMPWHQEPKKDMTSCERLRGAANKRYIRRYPNVGTHMMKNHISLTEYIG